MLQKGCISLVLLLLSAMPAWADVVVIVRKEAQSSGKYIRVCDIARVDGPDEQAREVAMTVLGPAPAHGETNEITRWDIETRLYEMGVAARVTFSGNNAVLVLGGGMPSRAYAPDAFESLADYPSERAGTGRFGEESSALPNTRLGLLQDARGGAGRTAAARQYPAPGAIESDPESVSSPAAPSSRRREGDLMELGTESRSRIARAVSDYFGDKYRAGNAKRPDIEVSAKIIGATGGVSPSAHEVRVEDAEGKIPGRAKVTLFVRDDIADEGRTVTVAADTEVYGLALVPVRNIARGSTLTPGDFKKERVRMEWGANYLPPRPKTVLGRVAARALLPGEAMRAEDTAQGEAVKRNQLVIVDTAGRGWRLQTKAKAQGGGAVGDIITVEDLETRTRYPVRITAPGSVSVIVNKDKIIYNRD